MNALSRLSSLFVRCSCPSAPLCKQRDRPFSSRRPHVSSGGLALGPTLASFCPSKQKDASHELGLTEPERYQQKPISAQIKGTAHPTCNWPLGARSPSVRPCAPSWLLRAFFGCVPSPDKDPKPPIVLN